MVLSTLGVAADVTPSVIETFFSHYLNRKPLREKPTAHISYHEGLRLIRKFLNYSSQHSVEDVQAFTAQWVPSPTWVKLDEFLLPESALEQSAKLIQSQLGPHGLQRIGGIEWWQWRRHDVPLKAEWIEMREDYNARQAAGDASERIILYIHGGAYYFGSVDEHRYQMQRHARKLKARLLAPRYRLAPQFPFPCGLQDSIAAYLYLLENHDPTTILFGGDSAGGGMVISMLVVLRDQGIPLPAGAFLLSPWVDLTHSFPSVAGDGEFDYIPANGFHHKPSKDWPPPNAADLRDIEKGAGRSYSLSGASSAGTRSKDKRATSLDAAQGFSETRVSQDGSDLTNPDNLANPQHPDTRRIANPLARPGEDLSIELDGKLVEIHDQIQMYASNQLLAHPFVSPVMQPSLGGLPPLLIQVGGGELLHDEQVYLAHKAANPTAYPAPDISRAEHDPDDKILHKYPPTDVHLQVWEDLCHVPHTLSFTRPAKFMYRSVAQFGAWALAHAQQKAITILDDDNISVISTDSGDPAPNLPDSDPSNELPSRGRTVESADELSSNGTAATTPIRAHIFATVSGSVGKAGDPLPPFHHHMIRQRVDRHGMTYPLSAPADLPCLHLDTNAIGVIKPGPVRKWIAKKREWDSKYASAKRAVQKQRIKELKEGFDSFGPNEIPPPTALAGRRSRDMEKQKVRRGKSWGLAMWSGWGSKHDETTLEREHKIVTDPARDPAEAVAMPEAGAGIPGSMNAEGDTSSVVDAARRASTARAQASFSRSRSPTYRTITDLGQADAAAPEVNYRRESRNLDSTMLGSAAVGAGILSADEATKVPGTESTYLSPNSARPHNGYVAYPFKLRSAAPNLSTQTLDEDAMVPAMGYSSPGIDGAADSNSNDNEQERDMGAVPITAIGVSGDAATARKELGHTYGAVEERGTGEGYEIGGHHWIMGSSAKQASRTDKGKSVAQEEEDMQSHQMDLADHSGRNGTMAAGKSSGNVVVENGEIVDAERPALNTFVTARTGL